MKFGCSVELMSSVVRMKESILEQSHIPLFFLLLMILRMMTTVANDWVLLVFFVGERNERAPRNTPPFIMWFLYWYLFDTISLVVAFPPANLLWDRSNLSILTMHRRRHEVWMAFQWENGGLDFATVVPMAFFIPCGS